MIKANHSSFWVSFSNVYSKYLLKLFFRNIRFKGKYEETNLPVLIISNHFSWWDGFIQIQMNNKYFKRRFHFMMLENELHESMILTKIGAYSILKNSRSSIETLSYTVERLENPENLVLFFPQGKIQSIYTNKFNFEKGVINYILKKLESDFQLVFNVNLIDYSSYRRPEITVYHKTIKLDRNDSFCQIEERFNTYANECLTEQRSQ